MILPGSTLGVMGGGQLGRMFGLAARRMGYRLHVFDPEPGSPAGQVADAETNAPYTDQTALSRFADAVDAVTFEFENIPAASLEVLAQKRPVQPAPEILITCQNREREKAFLARHGYPHASFRIIRSEEELREGIEHIGHPAVLKTASFGYDGKGQIRIDAGCEPDSVWQRFQAPRGVLEQWIDHERELSIIVCGSPETGYTCLPVAENIHTRHILDVSIVPARIASGITDRAEEIALSLARQTRLTGVLAVEYFLANDGNLLVNELAPRPHNSGHYSFDACTTNQFEQQVRTLCGMKPGDPRLLSPVVMVNLLGDLWTDGTPDWSPILDEPRAKLHLYGKKEARPGRKMGHFCVLDPSPEAALEKAMNLRRQLGVAAKDKRSNT